MKTIEEAAHKARYAQAWFVSADVTVFAVQRCNFMKWAMLDVEHVMRSLLLIIASASDAHARDVVVNFHERDAG